MQVVIEIPEEDYNFIKEVDESNYFVTINLYTAVYEGIILPKGHGRLVDADALLEKQYRIDDGATLSTRDVVNVEDVEDAPTIIEADKE